jgi:hypothetical protein
MTIRWVLSDFLQELSPALAEHLLETHFPGCKPILGPQLQSQQLTPSTKDWLIASSVITEEKIRLQTYAACGIKEESALHFICVCPTLANLRTQIVGEPILSVSKYEGMLAGSFVQFAKNIDRFETRVQ